ncbi:Gti1/Pac2 family-domain-containing protein [Mucidula mucida]|nr:Gti1/Pac2 family-domain-containing protein [Mucidula mucida]
MISLDLRDAHDAQVILEAVRRNILPLIKRRLVASERDQLEAGNVFVWEEEGVEESGLLRWTDGRRWSQSRMRGDFLFYEEKVETTQDERDAKAARRAKRAADPTAVIPPPTRRKDRPSKPNGLTKQTYSALVYLPGVKEGRKWHVVAYFSGKDYAHLPVIDQYENLRQIQVPKGVIMTTKTVPLRSDRFSEYSDDADNNERQAQLTMTGDSSSSSSPVSPSRSSSFSLPSPMRHDTLQLSQLDLTGFNSEGHEYGRTALPSLSTIEFSHPKRPEFLRSRSDGATPRRSLLPPPRSSPYAPLSAEDRRVLSSFRIVL